MHDDSLEKLSSLLRSQYPDSQLEPVNELDLQSLLNSHPDFPEHLFAFYRKIGCGSIGSGTYMIDFAIDPHDIYDRETAANLSSILIVGDNYAGDCDGYNIDRNWTFGSIGSSGSFEAVGDAWPTIVEWLLYMLGDD
ncbi:hypothetical protein [Lignipirellula cremea]|uniref:SMI1 / KNR4 family protein n=1 Tax=Lignipirellula cremea TaxID=2528010 RepID=A0A518DX80_9BACT|nr:hypothetical protein [Lignipirellula cremea]QDU96427.1 hypothetical protein Pla8534_42480 [Lignipirellula cremea]